MQSGVRRYVTVLAVFFALGFGIAIGALISHGAHAARPADASAEPQPLADPSPVELSNSFARVAQQIEPAVVNITTETTVRISGRGFGSQEHQCYGSALELEQDERFGSGLRSLRRFHVAELGDPRS